MMQSLLQNIVVFEWTAVVQSDGTDILRSNVPNDELLFALFHQT